MSAQEEPVEINEGFVFICAQYFLQSGTLEHLCCIIKYYYCYLLYLWTITLLVANKRRL